VTVFTFGIVQADVENALNKATVLALFDDGAGVVNAAALAAVIQAGELEMASWMVDQFGLPLPPDLANDPFFKRSALEFVVGFAVERHPEYAKQAGFGSPTSYFDRATARAERIAAARQRATTIEETPANVGGTTPDGAPRMYTPGANGGGVSNAGDF
jgi:hypothetical protein